MSPILDFFLLVTLLAAPIQPVKAPDSLREPGTYEPFWVSVSYAVDASGSVRSMGLDKTTIGILESAKAQSRRGEQENAVGPCETNTVRPFYSPTGRPYRSLRDLLEYAPTIYIGRIARMDPGFSSGMPSTLVAIEISQTPRSTTEFATSGIVFVEWRGADFEVFGKRFCNVSAFDTYSPVIGDTVVLFPYDPPVDSGRRYLYTAQEQLLGVRDGLLHASRGLVDRSALRGLTLVELVRRVDEMERERERERKDTRQYLESIELVTKDEYSPRVIFSDLSGGKIRHVLDLAEEIEGRTLVIRAKPDITKRISVYFQFETSMSVHEDGPHLDLLDWKHHTSDWVRLKGGPSYEIPLIPDEDERRFPPVTVEEIEAAIRERGEAGWVQAMRRHPDGITMVSVSAIRLRITIDEDGHERVLHTIEFEVPMGC